MKNCYNNAKIESESTNLEGALINLGGLCGNIALKEKADITNCYNRGEIIAEGGSITIGGITAFSQYNAMIKNTFNLGKIKGKTEKDKTLNIGGILGMDGGINISNSYNIGNLEGIGYVINVGGIVGIKYSTNEIINCKYLAGTCITGVGNGNATGVEELQNISDFPSVLEVVNGENAFMEDVNNINGGYPILKMEN